MFHPRFASLKAVYLIVFYSINLNHFIIIPSNPRLFVFLYCYWNKKQSLSIKAERDDQSGISLLPIINMAADSIKLFQFLEKYCQTFRVYPLQPNQKRYHINSLNWIIILCLNQFFISLATFFFFEATSMFEYGLTFFVCLCILSSDIHCFSAFGQAKDISNFVENWEKFIGKSKFVGSGNPETSK